MAGPDPSREPESETVEKKGVNKTHEEYVGDDSRPSMTKREYEKHKERERQRAREKSDRNSPDNPKAGPINEN